jgi:hypothetical protein
MSNLPFNLRSQLVTPASREAISEANAQTVRDEIEAERVDFDDRTVRLKALRTARDAKLKIEQLARRLSIRPGPRRT